MIFQRHTHAHSGKKRKIEEKKNEALIKQRNTKEVKINQKLLILKSKSDQHLPTTAKSHAKVLRQPSSQASLLPVPMEEREPGNEAGLERKKKMMKKFFFTFAQSLSHCELITDDGIRHFCGSPCAVDHIEELELDNCPLITDNALDYLM